MIDLRSDTVTKPTPAMRRAMFEAEVGDDVYREDPTVNRLEERAAEIAGKPAALFVPTGTMGNTIAVKLLTEHGQEVICDSRAHLLDYEMSMVAWFSGCVIRAIPTADGILSWEEVKRLIKPVNPYTAPTGLVEIENTHNMWGGTVYPIETIYEICDGAHEYGLKVHMDGARIFNAAEATGMPVREICAPADTMMFCLSKGLGAPEDSPKKLAGDHANARFLAEGLARIPGVEPRAVSTNIVVFDVTGTGVSPAALSVQLKRRGILMNAINDRQVRAVTHYDATREDCAQALGGVAEAVAEAVAR
jgi:threonine aldolase